MIHQTLENEENVDREAVVNFRPKDPLVPTAGSKACFRVSGDVGQDSFSGCFRSRDVTGLKDFAGG